MVVLSYFSVQKYDIDSILVKCENQDTLKVPDTFSGTSNWEENTDCFATPKWISFNMMQLQRGTNCTQHLVPTVGRSDNGQGDGSAILEAFILSKYVLGFWGL